jgi:hypothetical protein
MGPERAHLSDAAGPVTLGVSCELERFIDHNQRCRGENEGKCLTHRKSRKLQDRDTPSLQQLPLRSY